MAFDLSLEFILSGKPQRVMQLLTDAALIRKWRGDEAVFENKVGGKVELFDGWVKGEVLKTSVNELEYTWKPADWAEETGTKVVIKHTGFPNEKERDSHKGGWADFFFDPMEDFILIIDKS